MVITAGIAIWGLCQKQTYTNLLSQPEALNMLRVAEFPEALVPTMAEQALKELPESPIIIRATAMAEKDYLFSLNLQKVSVQQVYRGEGIEPGDEVQIALNTKFTINAQTIEGMVADEKIAELHFVNEMEEGNKIPKASKIEEKKKKKLEKYLNIENWDYVSKFKTYISVDISSFAEK